MQRLFTVTMAVYCNDNAMDFAEAVHSIYTTQTVRPSEIIIVVDGPIPLTLEDTLKSLLDEIDIIKIIRFDKNRGHAAARQAGLDASSNELVAIMDADDISVSDRFEVQLKAMDTHTDVAVVGGQIREFIGDISNAVGERVVPQSDSEIKKFLKARCPMNLMTVMYRKSMINAVGGFIDWFCEEDYYLWIRLALNGYRFYNVAEKLVNVRVGDEMYARRGGWKYFVSEKGLQDYMLNHHLISLPRYAYNVVGRFAIQVMLPNRLRGFIFRKLFRK